ncbi:UPF0158 family protein [Pseudalkalibacillus sp. A8]|uniref:UPF0158 family protein n=1 Tax=Pseudalkalibacillus sp. A8 TaxID=3382641 RepID=UPI0038B67C29
MEDFCLTISNERQQEVFLSSIRGKGAFRRFKDRIVELDIEEQWYSYRDERFKQIAIGWCRDNNINFIE